MKTFLKYFALAAAVAGLAVSAQAIPITGDISLAGNYTVTGGNLNTATSFATFSSVQVTAADGNFVGATLNVTGTVAMNPFTFNPFPGGGVVSLWSTSSGITASFDLTSLTGRDQPGDNTLTLHGLGTLHLTGFDPTPGTWNFSGNQSGTTLSFSTSNGTVPDGGTTALLLGLGLLSVGFVACRFKSIKA